MSDFSEFIISKQLIKKIIKQTWIRWVSFIICSLSLFDVMNCFSSLHFPSVITHGFIHLFFNVMKRIKIIIQAQPGLLNSFNFFIQIFLIWLVIDYITIAKMRSHKLFIVIRECWGSALFSFVMIPILFIALNIFSLIWWLEFKDPPKYIPKCVCQLAQKTGALSK